MSRYFVPITQPQIRNSLLDFSPVNQGLNAIGQAQQNETRNALMRDQMAMQQDQQQWARGRAEQQDARQTAEQGGKMAMAIMQMPDDDPAKASAWQQYLKRYGDGNHSPEELSHITGPKIAAAAFGYADNPMAGKLDQAKLNLMNAQAAAAGQRAEPDPMKEFVANKLRAMQERGRAPVGEPQQQGQVIPQSFDGGAGGIPGLQLASDATPAAQPQQAPALVDTPFGKMSREEARDLGSTMLLDPRYATAGKAILDAVEGPNQGHMGRTAQNQLEERTLNAAAQLGRLENIKTMFNPKFLEIPKRMEMLGVSWSAKMGAKLSPEQRSELSKYSAMRATIVNNLSTILKELSGAAVTPQEYERIKNDQPNAGTGIFDGDDPITLESKLNNSIRIQRQAIARYNYMRSKGLNFDKSNIDQFLALDDVPAAIDQRGAEIESNLRKSGADPNTIDQQVRRQLKQEFGI